MWTKTKIAKKLKKPHFPKNIENNPPKANTDVLSENLSTGLNPVSILSIVMGLIVLAGGQDQSSKNGFH